MPTTGASNGASFAAVELEVGEKRFELGQPPLGGDL